MGLSQSISVREQHALIGIDVGSSAVKACAFDLDGKVLSMARRPVPASNPIAGVSERDADRVWAETASALIELSRDLMVPVAALSITGCGNGAVFVDSSFRPIAFGIMSTDARAAEEVEPDIDAFQQRYAGQGRSLLGWFRRNYSDRKADLAWVLSWKDFVRAQLVGLPMTDPSDAGAAGFLDITSAAYAVDDAALPPLSAPTSIAGYLNASAALATGLPEGLPVAVGCVDFEAAAIGTGLNDCHTVSIVAGSWSINQTYTPDAQPRRGAFLCNPAVGNDQSFLVLEGSPNSSNHFEWFWQNFGQGLSLYELAERSGEARNEDVVFVPGLYSSGAHFVGLRAHHAIADLAHSVMRGVCFAHRRHIDALRSNGLPLHRATLAGGASASTIWTQLFADALEIPVTRSAVAEPGALGAAMIAGVAVGLWHDLAEAQEAMVPVGQSFTPRVDRSAQFQAFVEASERLQ